MEKARAKTKAESVRSLASLPFIDLPPERGQFQLDSVRDENLPGLPRMIYRIFSSLDLFWSLFEGKGTHGC
ncbi:MAG: hypothetical protein DSO03_02810 [Hadesarchaea archaeon]|nr:MAG: hypothetical protein DSO03_02810 [Hadesarchaea archaeon]